MCVSVSNSKSHRPRFPLLPPQREARFLFSLFSSLYIRTYDYNTRTFECTWNAHTIVNIYTFLCNAPQCTIIVHERESCETAAIAYSYMYHVLVRSSVGGIWESNQTFSANRNRADSRYTHEESKGHIEYVLYCMGKGQGNAYKFASIFAPQANKKGWL